MSASNTISCKHGAFHIPGVIDCPYCRIEALERELAEAKELIESDGFVEWYKERATASEKELAELKYILEPLQNEVNKREVIEGIATNYREWVDYAKRMERKADVTMAAEFERLRKRNLECEKRATTAEALAQARFNENKELYGHFTAAEARAERYKAALERIANDWRSDWTIPMFSAIAREALKDKV